MSTNYVLIDNDKLKRDAKFKNSKIGDGVSISKRLDKNGIGNAIFANSATKFGRDLENKKIDISKYEECDNPASMSILALNSICLLFGLDKNDYILKTKTRSKEELEPLRDRISDAKQSKEIEEIKNKIGFLNDQVCLIGNVIVKNMEYLKHISEQMEQLNDKWK